MRQVKASLFVFITYSLFAAGCINIPPLDCTEDSECKTSKIDGICVKAEGLPGACGLPDTSCSSGYRFYKDSSGGRSNLCATLPTFEVQITPTSVKEHEYFSVHIIAHDASGQKFASYKGKPTVTAEWGDARVFTSPDFINGEADYSIWVNRETNSKDGPEHVVVRDGAMAGRSGNLEVKLPEWKLNGTGAVTSGENYERIAQTLPPVFAKWEDGYHVYFSDNKFPNSIAETINLSDYEYRWSKPKALFAAPSIPWNTQPENVYPSGIVRLPDGSYIMSYIVFLYQYDYRTGLAKSSDRKTWTNFSNTPIDDVTGDTDCKKVGQGGIYLTADNKLRIVYNRLRDRMGFTPTCIVESSDNGTTWSNAKVIQLDLPWPEFPVTYADGIFRGAFGGTSKDGIKWAPSNMSQVWPKAFLWDKSADKYFGVSATESGLGLDFFYRD